MNRSARLEALIGAFGPFVLFVAALLIFWPYREVAQLDLSPYLEKPTSAGFFGAPLGEFFGEYREARPLAVALLLALVAAAVGALATARGLAYGARAGLLAGAVLCALPATRSLLALRGAESMLLALGLQSLAALILADSRALFGRASGLFLGVAGVLCDPASFPIAALLCFATGRRAEPNGNRRPAWLLNAVAFVLLAACAGFSVKGGFGEFGLADPPGELNRSLQIRLAGEHALVAPWLAVQPSPRDLLPTGGEALAGLWPLWPAAFGWIAVYAVLAFMGGISAATVILLCALATGFLAPLLTSGWVPGDQRTALLPLVILLNGLPLLARRLGGAILWRDALLGAAMGMLLIAVLSSYATRPYTPAEYLRERRTALGLPRDHSLALDLEREEDPARLLLYAIDLATFVPNDRMAAEAEAAIGRTLGRDPLPLIAPGRFAVARERLQGLVSGRIVPPPKGAPAGEKELLEDLANSGLEARIDELYTQSRDREAVDLWYPAILIELRDQAMPQMMRLAYQRFRTPRLEQLATGIEILARDLADIALVCGDRHLAIPLLEYIVSYRETRGTRADPTPILLGIALVEEGRIAEGRQALEQALPRFESRDLPAVLGRAARGRARELDGDAKGAFEDYERAWTAFALQGRSLAGVLSPNKREFWQVLELLYDRQRLAQSEDPSLAASARAEFLTAAKDLNAFGVRKVPGLLFGAEAQLLQADEAAAKRLLTELLRLEMSGVEARLDGAKGRLDDRRWRRLGLERLRQLCGEGDGDLVLAIDAKLAELRTL